MGGDHTLNILFSHHATGFFSPITHHVFPTHLSFSSQYQNKTYCICYTPRIWNLNIVAWVNFSIQLILFIKILQLRPFQSLQHFHCFSLFTLFSYVTQSFPFSSLTLIINSSIFEGFIVYQSVSYSHAQNILESFRISLMVPLLFCMFYSILLF